MQKSLETIINSEWRFSWYYKKNNRGKTFKFNDLTLREGEP